MTQTTPPTPPPTYFHGPISSVLQRLSRANRINLDSQILDTAWSARKIYQVCRLAGEGLSFRAFQRYVRNVRLKANMLELAERTAPHERNLRPMLTTFAGQRLLEVLTRPNPDIRKAEKLANIYRIAARVDVDLDKLDRKASKAFGEPHEKPTAALGALTHDLEQSLDDLGVIAPEDEHPLRVPAHLYPDHPTLADGAPARSSPHDAGDSPADHDDEPAPDEHSHAVPADSINDMETTTSIPAVEGPRQASGRPPRRSAPHAPRAERSAISQRSGDPGAPGPISQSTSDPQSAFRNPQWRSNLDPEERQQLEQRMTQHSASDTVDQADAEAATFKKFAPDPRI